MRCLFALTAAALAPAASPPRLERVPARLPERLEARAWQPAAAQPCPTDRPLILLLVRSSDDFSAARTRAMLARRFADALNVCAVSISPDAPARVQRWRAGRDWPLPLGAAAAWARRLDRSRRVELYLWLPRHRRLFELRYDHPAQMPASGPAQKSAADAGDLSGVLIAMARQNARAYDFDALGVLAETLPFDRMRQIVHEIETGPPPEMVADDPVQRGYWWYRLRWIMAHADPDVPKDALKAYLQAFRPPPKLDPAVLETLRATAEGLPADQLVQQYLAAAPDDGPVTLTIRRVAIAALEHRRPQTIERVVQQVALAETSPWLRSLLAARYLYSVRPARADQLAFLSEWRRNLPYYDLTACLIDSYVEALGGARGSAVGARNEP